MHFCHRDADAEEHQLTEDFRSGIYGKYQGQSVVIAKWVNFWPTVIYSKYDNFILLILFVEATKNSTLFYF